MMMKTWGMRIGLQVFLTGFSGAAEGFTFTTVNVSQGGTLVEWKLRGGGLWDLESSDDLRNWLPVSEAIRSGGQHLDAGAADTPTRFYRASRRDVPVILSDEKPQGLQRDFFTLHEARLDGKVLSLDVSYSGGCAEHEFHLFMSPSAFEDRGPFEADLWLQHEDHDDPCDAIVFETLHFDITPVVDLQRDLYGTPEEMILNVYEYFENEPGEKKQVTFVPEVLITDTQPADLQLAPFSLIDVSLEGKLLSLDISYGGGCQRHEFELFMSPSVFAESFPVQADLWLRHEANGDLCRALIFETVRFDITPIVNRYREAYGGEDEIILNVFEFFLEQPRDKKSVTYSPPK